MRKRITKSTVDGVKPQDKEQILWDDLLPGFGVRIRPSGRRYYVLKCTVGGQQRWLRLGRHGAITPDMARALAKEKLEELARGMVPSKDAPRTVADLCNRFTDEHLCGLKLWTRRCYLSAINKHVLPQLGKMPIGDVRHQDIARLHNQLRVTPYAANRARSVLSSVFAYAVLCGWLTDNPCAKVKPNKEEGRERYLSQDEMRRLLAVLDRQHNAMPHATSALKLLMYTGARKSEIVDLKWEWVDFEKQCLWLPDSKTGKKRVLLNDEAIEVLQQIPRAGPQVFVGGRGGRMWLQRPWVKLRKEAGLEDLRLHDLRHNFASAAVSAGLGLPVIGELLGHKDIKTTARYAHLYDHTLREAANTVGSAIGEARQSWRVQARENPVRLGSWQDLICDIENASVDLILSDPPYGMEYLSRIPGDKRWNSTGNSKGKFTKTMAGDCKGSHDDMDWTLFFNECHRVLAKDRYMFVHCDTPFIGRHLGKIEEAGFRYMGTLAWNKTSAVGGNLTGTGKREWEPILYLAKGNPKTNSIRVERGGRMVERARISEMDDWVFPLRKDELCGHPTQKPIELTRQVIRWACRKRGLVLDPFCGSGTTLLAAHLEHREAIGFEINPDYVEIASRRVADAARQGI